MRLIIEPPRHRPKVPPAFATENCTNTICKFVNYIEIELENIPNILFHGMKTVRLYNVHEASLNATNTVEKFEEPSDAFCLQNCILFGISAASKY